ncbi:MAG: hypothetical protein V8S24_01825 [Gordonibacter pamelaeae]
MPASVPSRSVSASEAGTIHAQPAVAMSAAASPSKKLGPDAPSAVSTVETARITRFAPSTSASAQAALAHHVRAGGSGSPRTGRSFCRPSRFATEAQISATAMGSMSAIQ